MVGEVRGDGTSTTALGLNTVGTAVDTLVAANAPALGSTGKMLPLLLKVCVPAYVTLAL